MARPASIAELCQRVQSRGPWRTFAALFLNQAQGEEANLALTTLLPVLQAFLNGSGQDEDGLVYNSVNAAGHVCERANEQVDTALVERAIDAIRDLADGPNVGVAHAAMYRLGRLGPRGRTALSTLEQIAGGGLGQDDSSKITRRARAYEALRSIDIDTAHKPAYSAARTEYLLACQRWLRTAADEGNTTEVERLRQRIEAIERESRLGCPD